MNCIHAKKHPLPASSASRSAELAFDAEAMLTACVPGGSIVDPQVVADNIRAWVADRKPGELADQKGVDMADVDSVALEIARRFIPVDSPGAHSEGQQRAALQVAIVGAITTALGARQPDGWADQHARDSKELRRLCESRDFYKLRCGALQAIQASMRHPERKAVCDILANGKTSTYENGAPAQGIDLVPAGWTIVQGEELRIVGPIEGPGGLVMDKPGRSLESRLLYALATALIDSHSDAAPGVDRG